MVKSGTKLTVTVFAAIQIGIKICLAIDQEVQIKTGKGAIMKMVMPRLKGKAEGKIINKIVTEIVGKFGE